MKTPRKGNKTQLDMNVLFQSVQIKERRKQDMKNKYYF